MLRNIKDLTGKPIVAIDGEIGTLHDVYFDDHDWTLRYLLAATGNYFVGKDVLLSPLAVLPAGLSRDRIEVSVTRRQADGSPSVDIDMPVATQRERSYYDYYGYPYYWTGNYFWVQLHSPPLTNTDRNSVDAAPIQCWEADEPHLRSAAKMIGCRMEAADGAIGAVESLVIDDATWEICYFVVELDQKSRARKVLIAPSWIELGNWDDATVHLDLSREAIASSPEYQPNSLSREYESKLYEHYDRPIYWALPAQPVSHRENPAIPPAPESQVL